MIHTHSTSALVLFSLFVPSLSPANAAERAMKVATVDVPHGGKAVAAKTDANGVIHLLYDSPDGPQYVRSTDDGQTFSHATAVVDRESRKPGLEFSAWDMAVAPDGAVHVALGTNAWKLKSPQEQWGYYYARLDSGAKAFSPLRNINRKPSEGYSLAADGHGNVTACWLSDKLYANVSHDGGASFGSNVEIDPSFNPCNCCTTSCAYGADGRLAILYREETNDDRDMYLVLWDQDRKQVTRTRVGGTSWKVDACPMTYYSVSATPYGFLAVWPTRGEIYFAQLDKDGSALSAEEVKTPGLSGMRTGVLALNAAGGNTLVAWKKDGQLGWQLYDKQGRPSDHAASAASAGTGAAGVVSKGGQFILFR
ncbi:MAG TPA: hypothetical protein VNH11_25145 [Pirellulales bacterium]|nr:hypothetical protein [Pirellulales bacterium]